MTETCAVCDRDFRGSEPHYCHDLDDYVCDDCWNCNNGTAAEDNVVHVDFKTKRRIA